MEDFHIPKTFAPPSALDELDDAELVRLLAQGQSEAMSVLFKRHYAVMMRVALRIVRNRAEAEDVVQVAFLDFYRQLELFDAKRGNLRAYLLQYTYGRGINRVKAMKVRHHANHFELSDVSPSELAAPDEGALDLNPPETKRLLEEMLGTLQEKKRRIVELVCFGGMTIPEVAALTKESSHKVHHDYYRALGKLRDWVKETERTVTKQEHPAPVAQKVKRKLTGAMGVETEEVELG